MVPRSTLPRHAVCQLTVKHDINRHSGRVDIGDYMAARAKMVRFID